MRPVLLLTLIYVWGKKQIKNPGQEHIVCELLDEFGHLNWPKFVHM